MTYDKLNVLVIITIGLGALYAVFLYKKTELQKKISLYVSLLSMVLLASLIFDYIKMAQDAPQVISYPSIQGIWPISCAVLSALAWAAIRRDEKLLRSMDRIR
jgi:apolipoprotein N-acyltransferase